MTHRTRLSITLSTLLAFGVGRGQAVAQDPAASPRSQPLIYEVPLGMDIEMRADGDFKPDANTGGQLGTDVHPDAYKEIIEDIKKKKPDLLVFTLDSADMNRVDYMGDDDQAEFSNLNHKELRRLVKKFQEETGVPKDRQCIWIKDCVGWPILLAFSWPTFNAAGVPSMFISADARLRGPLYPQVARFHNSNDIEVTRKWRECTNGMSYAFFEYGGHDRNLGLCFLRPDWTLSVSFKGRHELEWFKEPEDGDYTLDDNPKALMGLTPDTMIELGIARRLAGETREEQLTHLVQLRGITDYATKQPAGPDAPETVVVDQTGVELFRTYVEDWRDTYKECSEIPRQLQQDTDPDPMRELSRRQKLYENLLRACKKYEAVQRRLGEMGSIPMILARLEEIDEQRKGLSRQRKDADDGDSGGGRNGRGFGGGLPR
ncbi:MAG: hypothetical protein O2855_00700 [Planctomycetota bacterium]|nr:hypothetical protein [Planctomycetota bacterium]